MKDFWKMTLATVLGIFLVGVVSSIFGLMLIGSIAAIGSSKPVMPREAVLTIDFADIVLTEQSAEANPFSNPAGLIQGNVDTRKSLGIWSAIQAINTAAEDPAVKFLYIKADGASGGVATLEEFRGAIKKFRTSGKAVISYLENPDNASYYMASVADKVFMASYPGGMIAITGLTSQITYLKDILDKLGVNIQLVRHGKYKSAGETYIRNTISEENKLQYKTLLNTIWSAWSRDMASSRNITAAKFNSLVDALKLMSPEDMLKFGLVDELLTKEALQSRLCDLYGTDKYEKIKAISLCDYAEIKVVPNTRAKQKIAIIYADGGIEEGSGKQEVAGDRFASIIADVRKDSSIQAVVFRVNSPGGTVMASDKIKTEIDLLRKVKPVVASYGNYAASGGYWISNSCDHIFSNNGTLTGSIGVFGAIPEMSGLYKKVGVNVETVKTNAHGDMLRGTRAFNSAELAYMQRQIDDVYDKFTATVAEGRDLKQSYVDEIAQGRVWAGGDALNIGLVDEIGGIEDAIHYAIGLTGESSLLDEWQVVEYPKPVTALEQILDLFGGSSVSAFAGTPFERVEREFGKLNDKDALKVYARLPYEVEIE